MKKRTVIIFSIFYLIVSSGFTQHFTDINAPLPALVNGASLAWGDFDNDGDLDLVIAGQLEGSLNPTCLLFINNGSNIFTQSSIYIPPLYNPHVAWVDYDHDGWLDLIYSGNGSYGSTPRIYIYHNDSGTAFTGHLINTSETGIMAWADFNNDSLIDYVVSFTGGTKIYKNLGNYSFVLDTLITPFGGGCAEWIDYDKDGHLDLFVSGEGPSFAEYHTELFHNNGAGVFYPNPYVYRNQIIGDGCWGDFKKSGNIDMIFSGDTIYNDPFLKYFQNNGGGTFTELTLSDTIIAGQLYAGDFNNDGWLDALAVGVTGYYPNFNSKIEILQNHNGVFVDYDLQLPTQLGAVAVGDYDNDGWLDFAISGPNGFNGTLYTTRIYHNDENVFVPWFSIDSGLKTYPNPCSGSLQISLPKVMYNADLSIYNLVGQKVYSETLNGKQQIINFKLSKGIYFIRVKDSNETWTSKIANE